MAQHHRNHWHYIAGISGTIATGISKYDKLYLEMPPNGWELQGCCKQFIHFYNQKREHSELGYDTPSEWYRMAA